MPPLSLTSTILLVDDDEDLLFTMKSFLTSIGYRVHEATTAHAALALLDQEPIDLVITDVEMPGESGIDLLRQIRKTRAAIPVVIQTGRPQVEAAVECLKLGANDYLSKPVDMAVFEAKIKSIIAERHSAKAAERLRSLRPDPHGRVLGGYKIIKVLGEGNLGIVFLAERADQETVGRYALKILKLSSVDDEDRQEYTRRFTQEAQAAARVRHPNIVAIVEWGIAEEENIPFLVMEYIIGPSLREYIYQGMAQTYEQKTAILRQLAQALAAMHEHQITHRDIKPDNVIVSDDGRVIVTDFGIARLPESELTMTSTVLGTPAYLSPEGFESAKVDHRSDIFSFGVVAYELFLQRKPFIAHSIPVLAHHIRTKAPVAPRAIDAQFPLALQAIIAKCMKKNKNERYPSARELIDDLTAYLEGPREDSLARLREQVTARDWSYVADSDGVNIR